MFMKANEPMKIASPAASIVLWRNHAKPNFSLDRLLNEKRSSFRFGFEYLVNKYFEVRSGIQMSENNNRFGLGFSLYLPYVDISYGILIVRWTKLY